ncbi:MAG: hypothetical protein ACRENJ_00505 [Candidatus Eiseniibacteriota bacterium]
MTPPPPRLIRALELCALGLALVAIVRYMAPRVAHAWDFETFYYAAAALRAALGVALIATWSRGILRGTRLSLVVLATLLAFNAALVMDLRSGNMAIVEALPTAWGASWPGALLGGAPAVRPHGEFNPSALGMLDTLLGGPHGGGSWLPDLAVALWAAHVVILLIASRRLLRWVWRRQDPLEAVIIACLLFALLSPRMMAYSYLLLIPPAVMVIDRLFATGHAARVSGP